MGRQSLVMIAFLFVFWLVVCGQVDLEHILAGLVIAVCATLFWHSLGARLPALPFVGEIVRLLHSLVLLIGYILVSNLAVAKTLLLSRPPVSPVFITMDTYIKSAWGRILLATCITITPGTITVDVDPDSGRFVVHALTEQIAVGLVRWRLIDRIYDLENWRLRRP